MATQDRSPSLFLGQSWTSWADKLSITDGNDDEEDDKSDAKEEGDSMKLNKKDMDLFGFCPSREDFTLALCEVCNMLVKPQALKRHTELRHGPVASVTATLDEQAATSKALNSELAKTLSLPVTGFGKTSTSSKPPTKASLKQVPTSVRMVGNNNAGSASSEGNTAGSSCKANSASRQIRKANTNPVVKMERIPKEVATLKKVTTAAPASTTTPSPLRDVVASAPPAAAPVAAVTSTLVLSRNAVIPPPSSSSSTASSSSVASIIAAEKSVVNGGQALKKAILATRPLPLSLSSSTSLPVSLAAVSALQPLPLALTTTTTSVTYTRPSSSSSTATTTFALLSSKTGGSKQPLRVLSSALAATLTSSSSAIAHHINPLRAIPHHPHPHPHSHSHAHPVPVHLSSGGGSKSKKSPKERKFLPCKDREFDANKHCGVKLEDSGKPCTRSLTCKTHALGLRRAVPGRKKSFDDLLREHKAAKEALLKAKAEEQAAAGGGSLTLVSTHNPLSSAAPTLVTAVSSPAALAAVSAIKLGHADLTAGQRDLKAAASATLLSHPSLVRAVRPQQQRPVIALNSVFQKFTPGGSFPPSLTVKEEPSPILEPALHSSQSSERDGEAVQDKPDVTYLHHHPRPAAVCTFGARMAGGGCALFSRKTDLVRAAFLSALERQLNPPPHKKLCVESKLPKEPQMSSNSKDPYEFSSVDSGLGQQRQTVSFTIGGPVNATTGLLGKPLIKHKARSLSTHSLNLQGLALSSLSSPSSSSTPSAPSSTTPTSIAIPTLAAALLKPSSSSSSSLKDGVGGVSVAGLQRGTTTTLMLPQSLANAQALSAQLLSNSQSVKRKRSGSSQQVQVSAGHLGGPGGAGQQQQHGVPCSTFQIQGGGVGLTMATGHHHHQHHHVGLNDVNRSTSQQQQQQQHVHQQQQQQQTMLMPVSSVNSHSATTPITAITIPSVNLANAATLGLSATLPNHKTPGLGITTTGGSTNNHHHHSTTAVAAGTVKGGGGGNIIKDFNLVVTGLDPLVNGQYLNITGAQLAELAAAQAMSATAEDKNIKRSRLAASAKHHHHHHANASASSAHKISGTLETLRALQGSSMLQGLPQNAVLVDGSLQGAVLTPVSSLGGGGGGLGVGGTGGNSNNNTYVALTGTTLSSSSTQPPAASSVTVAPNTIFRTISESGTPQQVTLSTASFTNGIISSGDKVHLASGGTHNQHQHHHHHHQQQQQQQHQQHQQQQQQQQHHHHHHRIINNIAAGGRVGGASAAAGGGGGGGGQQQAVVTTKSLQGAAQGLLAGGTPLTPAQLAGHLKQGTFNISNIGKGGKMSLQPVSVTIPLVNTMGIHPHHHAQPTLLVTTTANDVRPGVGGVGAGGNKTEIHLQPQISGTSSGMIS